LDRISESRAEIRFYTGVHTYLLGRHEGLQSNGIFSDCFAACQNHAYFVSSVLFYPVTLDRFRGFCHCVNKSVIERAKVAVLHRNEMEEYFRLDNAVCSEHLVQRKKIASWPLSSFGTCFT
jgi:hypothetical protein